VHARGILWAPDAFLSAGGIVSAVAREIEHAPAEEADRRVRDIGRRLGEVLAGAADRGVTPLAEARRRLNAG
jgi:glutamate dehydrogenase/leucine dehydrogenase